MFITLPKVFSGLSAGTFVGILFFFLVLCAALTSSIALTESAVYKVASTALYSSILIGAIIILLSAIFLDVYKRQVILGCYSFNRRQEMKFTCLHRKNIRKRCLHYEFIRGQEYL